MKRRSTLPLVVVALFVTAACSEPGRIVLPSSPSTLVGPPALPGAPSTATPISVGQSVRATVTLSDRTCDVDQHLQPCSQFAIVPETTGLLWVRLSSAGPSELALKIAGLVRGYDVKQIEASARVIGGQKYEVSVALHNAMNGNTGQIFELTTRLDH